MRTEEELRSAMADAGARVPGAGPDARQSVARRVRRQRTARLAPVALIAAALAFGAVQLAGSNGTHKSLVVTNPPATEVRPEPTTVPAGPPTTVRPRTSADPCLTTQLKITAQQGSGAGGHGNVVIVFLNEGPPCRMTGFPGVAALGADGSQRAQARRTATGFFGGLATGSITPPAVQLPTTGGIASAILEGLNASPPDGAPCPAYSGLLVTPPGQTQSTRVPVAFSMCDLEIHPVVPGSDGGTGTSCPGYTFRPQSSDVASNVTAYATTCAVARSVVAGGPYSTSPNFGKDYAAAGFTCSSSGETQAPGGGAATWSYNCTDQHGARVIFDRHA